MRIRTEWLVLPLFLLPWLILGAFMWWAQDRHYRARAPFRRDGQARAQAWLADGGPAAWMRERVASLSQTPLPAGVRFEHPLAEGLVIGHGLPSNEAWTFTAALSSPLSPALLSESGTRLAVETGRAPADIAGAAPGAVALRDLLATPDLDRLREAPLPLTTKRYVLARWGLGPVESDESVLPAGEFLRRLDRWWVDRFLADVERFLRLAREREGPPPLGAHDLGGGAHVLGFGGATPARIFHSIWNGRRQRFVEEGPPDSPVRLIWRFPEGLVVLELQDDADVVWFGRLETPLAGTLVFQERWGTWWEAPWVKRWGGPVVLVWMGALALLGALYQSIGRRRRLDEARVRFMNEMAHDLRTPLASLRLHADMLSEGRGKPEKREDYLHLLSREAARLSSLLANLLDLSRLEQGRRRLETGTVDVGDLAYRAVRELVLLQPDREPDVQAEGPEKTWARGDATALSRCLANLLENAGKFTTAGTPIRVRWAVDGAEVVLQVADEGPGITASERRTVFERYARGTQARRDGVPGTGLGLSLVRELIEGMGGTVALLPSETGAVFELRLPRATP